MYKYPELKQYIDTLDEYKKNLRQVQKEFRKTISSKLSDSEKENILNTKLSNCVTAYYKYLDHLDVISGLYLSGKYKKDNIFKGRVESAVTKTKINYILKENYPNIWTIKCELLGEIRINSMDPSTMAEAMKEIILNPPIPYRPINKVIETGISSNEFYAEFGTRVLYVIGVELEKFYKDTVHVLKAGKGWDAKDKREIRYMIDVFKSCKGHDEYMSDSDMKRWRRKVDRAIGLYQKHWYGLWN